MGIRRCVLGGRWSSGALVPLAYMCAVLSMMGEGTDHSETVCVPKISVALEAVILEVALGFHMLLGSSLGVEFRVAGLAKICLCPVI